ncbi:leukemia-associated protein 7 [Bufo gargarizans]|uniref:leukemia-associated protein 7 n=1 Tax=Bufo gargarizans TaxID=30331 RepID=UPI001CF56500|nr:leukemia-associated protein 7 [Bufo gargarizans]XP_044143899.1 leukemia-associated protein 7 [Bufo gargarizans]XP_044143900.1 leukemia-associated protein 7 [Bufo gargarizans]
MPGPTLVRDVLSHQTQAFTTLITLLEERGIRCNNIYLVEGASGSSLCYTRPPARLTDLDLDLEGSDTASISSTRSLTLAQKASRNRLSRVARSTLSLLVVEENILDHLPLDHQFSMQLKDSIEFRNICTHLALQTDDRRFDQDLNLAQKCLSTIITNMTWDITNRNCDFCETVQEQLKLILQKLHED